jgi:hypothetical protein
MSDETFSFDIEADIYKVSRRPDHHEIVVIDGYSGVRRLDLWQGRTVAQVPFTEAYAP